MESKQASDISIESSGISSIKNSSLYDSEIENLVKTNGVQNDAIDNSNNGSVIKDSSSEDDGGFVSGEEDFETASERPIVADPDEEEEEEEMTLEKGTEPGDPFVGSSVFVTPREIPVALASEDVDENPKVENLDGGVDGVGSGPVVENGVTGEILVASVDSNSIGVELPEVFVEATGENLNSSELVEENGLVETRNDIVEESVGRNEDKVTENVKLGDVGSLGVEETSVPEGVGLEGVKLKGDEDVEGIKIEDSKTESSEIIEPANSVLVESQGVKFTSEVDSVVEAIHVDLSEKGVAVVGEREENKDPEAKQAEVPVESQGVKLTSEGDSVVEAIHVDLSERGVAVVGETEENKDPETTQAEVPVNGSGRLDLTSEPLTNHGDETSEPELVVFETEVPVKIDRDDAEGNEKLHVAEKEKSPEAEVKPQFDSEAEKKDSTVEVAVNGEEPVPEVDHVGAYEDGLETVVPVSEATVTDMVEAAKHLVDDLNGVSGESHLPESDEKDGILDLAAVTTDDTKGSESPDTVKKERTLEAVTKAESDLEAEDNDSTVKIAVNGVELVPDKGPVGADEYGVQAVDSAGESKYDESSSVFNPQVLSESEDEVMNHTDEEVEIEGSLSDGEETDGLIFGNSEAAKQFIEELERGSGPGSQLDGESSHDHSQRIDGQIVTDSDDDDEEGDADEGDGKELFDSAALAALLKAATGADPDNGSITISSQDGSRLFSVERPAGLGSSLRSLRPTPRSNQPNIFSPSLTTGGESENNLSEEEKNKLEKLQAIRVKFLRIVQRLGLSPDESIAAQVMYRLALVAGRQTSPLFSLDTAKRTAVEHEADGNDSDLDFSVNIVVLGKSGVGKSATINSIFNEEKVLIDAFESTTSTVKEISGMVDGVKIKVFDTPGLKSSVMEQAFNRKLLSSVTKITKKSPADIVLYVDRLDSQTRDLNDLPLLKTITGSLGQSIWRNAIVTLTHGASAPPDGPSGSPLSYEVFVAQRSHVVQHSIGQAVGDLRMMSPSLMNPVSLVENHPSCRKNREGQKVLPNGQSWRPQLLLLCYSMKILAEASALSKSQDPFDHRKLFGRVRAPPLPYLLSSMLQTRAHPKLSSDQGGENGDSDVDLADLSDSDQEDEEDEYDQLPPFKPLRKSQISKLSKEQKKAYFEEYDYRVKLLRKKQWREELKRLREMKKRGNDGGNDYGYIGDDADQENSPAPVAVPLPDMALPPSFDGGNQAYRYRFLEPSSQFLARPVLDPHGWDHDCGYDGVSIENSLAIAGQFPAAAALQITKDKKEFSIHLDSSVAAKHGEDGSSMAGFDIQTIGKQLAYVIRGETKFKSFKKNKTATGLTITFLGENVATGFKIEDQISLGKQWGLMGSGGIVRAQGDSAYGANFELQHRELDYPIGQVQSTYSLSLIRWRGDWALGFNTLAQFSVGRTSKVAVRAGINNKLSGQITVRTSSSENLSFALAGIIPIAINIYKKIWPSVGESYSVY